MKASVRLEMPSPYLVLDQEPQRLILRLGSFDWVEFVRGCSNGDDDFKQSSSSATTLRYVSINMKHLKAAADQQSRTSRWVDA